MAIPLDAQLARTLAPTDVRVVRDPHLGTGISKSFVVDWGKLSARQVAQHEPDAVVVFIGANEGFPMQGPGGAEVECCGADWAALYADRVRQDDQHVPPGRRGARLLDHGPDPARRRPRADRPRGQRRARGRRRSRGARRCASSTPSPTFTPGGYRDAMPVDGRETIVRDADGIHLNEAGADLLADAVLEALRRDFEY